ncbi:Transthyretin-like family protein [Oesophagostomum dentatum]|uniref:Transthyretin-like family protein n=1 Tax=Oesophagostomum dentatum TaxID=61180 RepID=A0A0B1TCN4_OESDE|nr:Transthyretin-like family protein [Oesophagostomum dentatum]
MKSFTYGFVFSEEETERVPLFDSDDLLGSVTADERGIFCVRGATTEVTDIEPYIYIEHNCGYEGLDQKHYQRRMLTHHDASASAGKLSLHQQVIQCIPHYVAYKDYYEKVVVTGANFTSNKTEIEKKAWDDLQRGPQPEDYERERERERQRQEEQRRIEEEARIDEERRAEERRRIEEERRIEEQRRMDEIRRLEDQRRLEEERKVEEQRKLDEDRRLEEERRLEEQRKLDEDRRLEEQRLLEEQRRLEEERRHKEAPLEKEEEEQHLVEEEKKYQQTSCSYCLTKSKPEENLVNL